MKLAIAATTLAVAVGAGVLFLTLGARAEPVPLDPALARWYPIDQGQVAGVEANWGEGRYPLALNRSFPRWESLDGESHLLMEWSYYKRRRLVPYAYEWLRPAVGADGVSELLCSQRRMGVTAFRLEPPQPILRAPLSPGQRWTWRGRVAGERALARFFVSDVFEHEERGPALDVSCVTISGRDPALLDSTGALGGLAGAVMGPPAANDCRLARRTQTLAEGVGLVRETGVFPVERPNQPTDYVDAVFPPPPR